MFMMRKCRANDARARPTRRRRNAYGRDWPLSKTRALSEHRRA
jgi:hypothetical protein